MGGCCLEYWGLRWKTCWGEYEEKNEVISRSKEVTVIMRKERPLKALRPPGSKAATATSLWVGFLLELILTSPSTSFQLHLTTTSRRQISQIEDTATDRSPTRRRSQSLPSRDASHTLLELDVSSFDLDKHTPHLRSLHQRTLTARTPFHFFLESSLQRDHHQDSRSKTSSQHAEDHGTPLTQDAKRE